MPLKYGAIMGRHVLGLRWGNPALFRWSSGRFLPTILPITLDACGLLRRADCRLLLKKVLLHLDPWANIAFLKLNKKAFLPVSPVPTTFRFLLECGLQLWAHIWSWRLSVVMDIGAQHPPGCVAPQDEEWGQLKTDALSDLRESFLLLISKPRRAVSQSSGRLWLGDIAAAWRTAEFLAFFCSEENKLVSAKIRSRFPDNV